MELLVKLANFGATGVSLAAIFYIIDGIKKLPDTAPAWKPRLLSRCINMCIFLALISGASGAAISIFNQNNTKMAKEETARVETEYHDVMARVGLDKGAVVANLDSFKQVLAAQHITLDPVAVAALERARKTTERMAAYEGMPTTPAATPPTRRR